jgi:hypothetical protein
MRIIFAGIIASMLLSFVSPVGAAIQFNGTTQQAPFAASTTQQVGNLLNQVVSGDLGTTNGSSTVDAGGILNGVGRFFAGVNTWLKEKAGIDFFAILKGIGHFFIIVVQFVVDLIRKAL